MDGEKKCTKCLETKKYDFFYKSKRSKDRLQFQCKLCIGKRVISWRNKNAEKIFSFSQDTIFKCLSCQKEMPFSEFRISKSSARGVTYLCRNCSKPGDKEKRYGIKESEIKDILKFQKNKCGCCRKDISEKFNIDHCHTTGRIRGLLCRLCNSGIGSLGDSIEGLTNAINYLKERS